MKITNEVKTGFFVVLCLIAFGALAIKVGKFSFIKSGYTIKTHFQFTAGVKKHAPVCLSGVEVGEIKDIRIVYGDETMVELDLAIHEGVKIYLDSKAMATTLGLMGEKYIEIKAGTVASGLAKDGDTINSIEPFRMEDLVEIGKRVASDISLATNNIGSVARHVDEVIVENHPKINDMMENFDETSENFREFSDDVKYHPWKVLLKGKEVSKEEREHNRAVRLKAKALAAQGAQPAPTETTPPAESVKTKQNFSPKNRLAS